MDSMPYTMGIFQYSLLYAWPQPGKIAERRVAMRGLCLGTVSFFIAETGVVLSFFTGLNALVVDSIFLSSCDERYRELIFA